MLVDKIDTPISSSALSVQTTTDTQNGRYSVTKLPRISNTPSSYSAVFSNDPLSANSRQPISIPSLEKVSFSGIENPVGRGPKIYKRNLPEVFTSAQPGNRIKKIPGVKERSKEEYGEQLAIQLATPPNSHFFGKNKYHQPFISPARLGSFATGKSKRKLNAHLDLFPPSMKENIEDLSIKFGDMSPSRLSIKRKNESYVLSPPRRPHRVQRSDTEFPPVADSNISVRNDISKEDDMKRQIKKMIIFKKKASNTSESKFFISNNDELKLKMMERLSAPNMAPVLQLNELITVKKIKNTTHNGVIKRMLHVPSFRLFDIMEEPISDLASHENYDLKSWINTWKNSLSKSRHVAKIYSCFWNSPEGKMSIVCEPFKNGSLNDLLSSLGNLTEKSLQTVAKEILTGIVEIQTKMLKSHGNITAEEIIIDSHGTLKISPGISNASLHSNKSRSPRSIKDNILRPSLRFPQSLDERSPPSSSSHRNEFAQDIFDFGFILLQCALGDLSIYDFDQVLTLDNLKNVISSVSHQKQTDACCLLHSEDLARKIISVNSSLGPLIANGKKRLLPLEDPNQGLNSKNNYLSLYEALASMNKFSETFIDFLCGCLKLDPEQRFTAEDLLDHEFLNEYHETKGPQVTFQEILSVYIKGLKAGKIAETEEEKELYKLGEALRVVFLNRHVKEKFDMMVSRNFKGELDEKRVNELASEIGVSTNKLKRKLADCLKDL